MTGQNGNYFDAETIHNVSLASLHEEFAEIMTTEQFIKEITLKD